MNRHFRLRVPGSTSNLGSGFDVISAAVQLYLTLEVQMISDETGALRWPDTWALEPGENAIEVGLRETFRFLDLPLPGLQIKVDSDIPLKRGLGSSAAAFVAGARMAEELTGVRLQPGEVFEILYPLEGHPDNLAASYFGGWVLSWVDGPRMNAEKLDSRLDLRLVAAIPDRTVSTAEARRILPAEVALSDAVFNMQRCALLVVAIQQGRVDLLREATRDRLHQEYRARLIPGTEKLLLREGLEAELDGAVHAVTVSGSGSTLVALVDRDFDAVACWMESLFRRHGIGVSTRLLEVDNLGPQVEKL